MTIKLQETTVRDFGGGWDVSDSDKSLGSKYQPISDNIIRLTDGSFAIRQGTRFFADMRQGVETVVAPAACTVTTVLNSTIVKITKAAHGLVNGNHINITSWTGTVGTIVAADALGMHGVHVIDASNFNIYIRKVGITAGSGSCTIGWTTDTHMMGGRDIYGRYFKDNLLVFSDIGEIVAVNNVATVTPVWNISIARLLTTPVEPWGPCQRISAEIVRGHLIAVNGASNDKPLDITANAAGVVSANYLVNEAVSNAAIPRADFIIAADRYVLLVSTGGVTGAGPTQVAISARDTIYVFEGDPSPADAKTIDLGMLTSSTETTILGANVIRANVFIAFQDRSLLGELGIYNSVGVHTPDFKDNVSQVGTYAHHSILSLGNDLFCAGISGISSLQVSVQSGEFTPATISDLIHPVMLRHMNRLSETDRRYRTFAVWDSNARQYMLFMPKYSNITYTLPDNPIIVSSVLQANSLAYLVLPSHALDAGDYITISGVTGSPDGFVTAGMINGVRRIRAVFDADTVVIEVGAYPTGLNYAFGGNAASVLPVNDETPAYVYEYNSRMKIKRWTRYRGLDFDWGAVSQLGSLFFGKNGRIYRLGNASNKYPADKLGDYTVRVWANSTAYTVGQRILDPTVKEVFIVLVNHTTPGSGTFKAVRDANITWYTQFRGVPINWELETSWTDFKERMTNKQVEVVRFDTKGSSEFLFSIYTNSIREDFETFALIPNRTTLFIGEDSRQFGAGGQPYGGGRNTRQEWLRGMPVYGKMFRLRFEGSSIEPLTISAATMYYRKMPGALT